MNALYKEFIMCIFYSPPRKGSNQPLSDYLVESVNVMMAKYSRACFFIMGDKNSLDMSQVIRSLPNVRQIVTRPTYKNKILDIIVTNAYKQYAIPVILPPPRPDNPITHKNSDHAIVMTVPIDRAEDPRTTDIKIKVNRPIPESSKMVFAQMILRVDWNNVYVQKDTSDKVETLDNMIREMVDIAFPPVTTKVHPNDKPYITAEIKKMDRKRKREFRLRGKSAKYHEINSVYKRKIKEGARKYIEKKVTFVKKGNPRLAAKTLK